MCTSIPRSLQRTFRVSHTRDLRERSRTINSKNTRTSSLQQERDTCVECFAQQEVTNMKNTITPVRSAPRPATRGLDSSFEILKTKHLIYLYETTVQLLVPSQIRTRTRKSTFSVANWVSRTLADKTSQVLKITTRPHKPTKEGFES